MRSLILSICLIVLSASMISGQQGVYIGLGDSFIPENFPEDRSYHIWLVSAGFTWRLIELSQNVALHGIVDLQYGDASTRSLGNDDFDIAANFCIQLQWDLNESVAAIASIGSGPGYQSSVSIVQARGFVFSNNFSAGFLISAAKGAIALTPQVRFRHMSNASLKSPNHGIDNFLVSVGLRIPITK